MDGIIRKAKPRLVALDQANGQQGMHVRMNTENVAPHAPRNFPQRERPPMNGSARLPVVIAHTTLLVAHIREIFLNNPTASDRYA